MGIEDQLFIIDPDVLLAGCRLLVRRSPPPILPLVVCRSAANSNSGRLTGRPLGRIVFRRRRAELDRLTRCRRRSCLVSAGVGGGGVGWQGRAPVSVSAIPGAVMCVTTAHTRRFVSGVFQVQLERPQGRSQER